ncbi:MAG: universal stress protein [Actinomycetales bacterium]|nr:universal stress protein [Actinomycetales bacterium]
MKLLVAVDGSDHAAKAVAAAGSLAAAARADVVVVHQRSDEALDHGPAAPSDEAAAQAQSIVDSAVAVLTTAGAASVTGRVLRGLKGEEAQAIMDVAREEDADIIVVGPRGLGRLAGLLVGSVTDRLVQLSDRPVLVVR